MTPHTCKPAKTCKCYMLADEPSEDCPVHGWGDDRRCGECGRFLKRERSESELADDMYFKFGTRWPGQ